MNNSFVQMQIDVDEDSAMFGIRSLWSSISKIELIPWWDSNLLARYLHLRVGKVNDIPPINCSAINANLLEWNIQRLAPSAFSTSWLEYFHVWSRLTFISVSQSEKRQKKEKEILRVLTAFYFIKRIDEKVLYLGRKS